MEPNKFDVNFELDIRFWKGRNEQTFADRKRIVGCNDNARRKPKIRGTHVSCQWLVVSCKNFFLQN